MDAKHTPGPWSAKTDGKYLSDHTWTVDNDEEPVIDAAPIHANGHVIAMVVSGDMDDGLFDANARLIAAAPMLLAALQNIVASLSEHDDEGMIEHAEQMIAARAAIATATQPEPTP